MRKWLWRASRVAAMTLACVTWGSTLSGQQTGTPQQPYAKMDRNAVSYNGPGRDRGSDLHSNAITIGLLLPLEGPDGEAGKRLLAAAQRAVADENVAETFEDGKKLVVVAENSAATWGQASSSMVRLITQENSVALLAGPNGNIAHQAEQIANKIGIPIVTLASDTTTTQINIPWIFRMAPSDAEQAALLSATIYAKRSGSVLLLAETDHDGREGKAAFLKAAGAKGEHPATLDIDPSAFDAEKIEEFVSRSKAETVVIWSGPKLAAELVEIMRTYRPSAETYLCQKASVGWSATGVATAPIHGVALLAPPSGAPVSVDQQMYIAVRLIAAAVRIAGNNRARVRDALSEGKWVSGDRRGTWFDPAGNLQISSTVVSLAEAGSKD